MALSNMIEKARGYRVGHVRHKCAILLAEDVLFFTREQQVGQRSANFVRHVGQARLPLVAQTAHHDDLRKRRLEGGVAKSFTPGEAGLLIAGCGDKALKREVFCKRNMTEHEGYGLNVFERAGRSACARFSEAFA